MKKYAVVVFEVEDTVDIESVVKQIGNTFGVRKVKSIPEVKDSKIGVISLKIS